MKTVIQQASALPYQQVGFTYCKLLRRYQKNEKKALLRNTFISLGLYTTDLISSKEYKIPLSFITGTMAFPQRLPQGEKQIQLIHSFCLIISEQLIVPDEIEVCKGKTSCIFCNLHATGKLKNNRSLQLYMMQKEKKKII